MLREKVTNVISKKPILFLTFFEMTRTHFLFQTQCACHTNQISSILAYHDFQLDSECNRLKWWHSDGKTDTSNGSIAHLLHRYLISLQNMNIFIYIYNIYKADWYLQNYHKNMWYFIRTVIINKFHFQQIFYNENKTKKWFA